MARALTSAVLSSHTWDRCSVCPPPAAPVSHRRTRPQHVPAPIHVFNLTRAFFDLVSYFSCRLQTWTSAPAQLITLCFFTQIFALFLFLFCCCCLDSPAPDAGRRDGENVPTPHPAQSKFPAPGDARSSQVPAGEPDEAAAAS